MKKYKLQERKEEKRRAAETERTRPLTDDEMWSRLDDLEEQELKHREMEKWVEDISNSCDNFNHRNITYRFYFRICF